MKQPDPPRLAEIEQALVKIQPVDEYVHRIRYDHGGGRMYRESPDGRRSLIVDVYAEGDREFYFRAAEFVRDLLAASNALQQLLQEARREHSRGYQDESADYPPCPKSEEDADENAKCTCMADAWNARVDAALAGLRVQTSGRER